jgi:uncharacterized protein (DUF3084 family)
MRWPRDATAVSVRQRLPRPPAPRRRSERPGRAGIVEGIAVDADAWGQYREFFSDSNDQSDEVARSFLKGWWSRGGSNP